jgi:hypothetical protein
MANSRKRISELPPLNVATLDTTFVLGISGSTTYKISINNLTSSLDGAFATDLVTNALSTSLDSKLSTSSFQSFSSSVHQRILDATNEQSFNGLISGSSQLTSSYDARYVISGSITQTTWDNIANKPSGIVSQSTDLSSLNSKTGSYATTGSNEFNGNQTINGIIQGTGSLYLKADSNDNRHFEIYNTSPTDVHIKSNGGLSFFGDDTNYLKIDDSAGDVTIAAFSDIILTADDGGVYIGSYGSDNGVITNGYLNTIIGDTDIINGATGNSITDNLNNIINNRGIVSSSAQISDLGFVTGSYTTINTFNSLTQSFNSISQSFTTISGSVGTIDFSGINAVTASYLTFTQSYTNDSSSFNNRITTEKNRIDAILSASNANGDTFAEVVSLINSVDLTNDNAFATFYTASNSRITSLENSTGSYLTTLNGAISSSSQLTSSYDVRYTLSGSVQPLPSNLVSSSAQITAFGFISSSATINTSSFATTGSNSFNGNQNITGSLVVSSVAVVAGALTIPSASVISLTSGSSISIDASGAITGSLTGSVFGIGDVVTFSASLNSRIISGSAVAGTISGSSQLTSSYDGRYVQTGSFNTFTASVNTLSSSVDSRFDTLEGTIISGSPNYTQVLGNKRTGITTTGSVIISGSITTTGNPVQIMVTGDANPVNVSSWTRLQIYRDETAIGNIVQVENSSNLNVPYCVNVIDTASAGTYTYSMRTVSGISGLFDFGESMGPTLTMVELNTNTNLPSTNNVFTGTNRFNGQVTIGGVGGDEGGELRLVTAQTNTTLTGGYVSADIYQNRLRFFEGGGNNKGVYVDLSKTPDGNAGELMWKVSGFVNAGTFLTLDNLKVSVTTGGTRGLSVGAVSTNFTANISGLLGWAGGGGGASAVNIGYGTTGSTSAFGWNFTTEGDGSYYTILDKTNSRFYRVTLMIGGGYNNNFISIERLF